MVQLLKEGTILVMLVDVFNRLDFDSPISESIRIDSIIAKNRFLSIKNRFRTSLRAVPDDSPPLLVD
jgi:hypothetical protein